MSVAPEISFPDPSEAIAKTDMAIAESGGLQEQKRRLESVAGASVSEKLASARAVFNRGSAEATIEVPAVPGELEEAELETVSAIGVDIAESHVTGTLPPETRAITAHGGRSDVAGSSSPGPLAVKGAETATENSLSRIRYRNFIVTGAVIGIVAAAVLIVGLPGDAISGQWAAFGYLAAFFGVVCGILGGLVAVLTDKKRVQR